MIYMCVGGKSLFKFSEHCFFVVPSGFAVHSSGHSEQSATNTRSPMTGELERYD